MDKAGNKIAKVLILLGIAILVVLSVVLVKRMIPSKKVMDLNEYYKTEQDKMLIVLQNEISEKQALYLDNTPYIDYETVSSLFNKRFYWDVNENVLIYTTQTEVIKTQIDSNDYYVNKSKASLSHPIVKTIGEEVFIALDFVKMYTNIEYHVFEKPNRVVIQYNWGKDYLFTEVKKATQLRYAASIKSDILVQLSVGDKLVYVDEENVVEKGFSKVVTSEGIIGYVKNKYVKDAYYETLKNDYKDPGYSHMTKDYKINLVWHQVTNQAANNNLLNAIDTTKGLTTLSPTWFAVANVKGEISSLASETYVERAHKAGLEVWALCNDFDPNVDMFELLSYTSRREKLVNELIAKAISYNLDGINIDFENISSKAGKHYIQFLRELSIKCRNNGIILSVDNYVPAPYNKHYYLEEQGEIVDYVIIMAYDEHHSKSEESGSVSSIGYVETAIKDTLSMMSKDRIIMGIPFYTRLWTEKKDGTISAVSCGMNQGRSYLSVNGVEPVWDNEVGQYYGEYKSDEGLNRIWLEEDKSIELKMKAIHDNDLAGVAEWKLGMEKESVWNVIQKYTNYNKVE